MERETEKRKEREKVLRREREFSGWEREMRPGLRQFERRREKRKGQRERERCE